MQMKTDRRSLLTTHRRSLLAYVVLALCLCQTLLVLVSWIVTAAMPEVFTRSLLSAEGIRWFFGRFQENMSSPLLVWLVVGSIAWGAVRQSGLLSFSTARYRQRIAMWLVVTELLLALGVILLLTVPPHAILLNVMGGLWPSSFSESIVPYVCLTLTAIGITYGRISRQLPTPAAAIEALTAGIKSFAPLFLLYILAMQLYQTIVYLFVGSSAS